MQQHSFKAISLSYKHAPLHVREQISLDEATCNRLLVQIREVLGIHEAMVLSTCNRTEIYYNSEDSKALELIKLLAIQKGVATSFELVPYFKVLDESAEAVQHLYNVSMGLESQVVGDIQISNQVKRAYQCSADQEMAGTYLHRLMHTIFFTNKKVVQETEFRDGAASVSYATVKMLEEMMENFINPKILVVGLGEIGADVVRNLQSSSLQQVVLCNRTEQKAKELAEECGFETIPFSQVWEVAKTADAIISSIGRDEPFFNKAEVSQFGNAHQCFFDLSVPRSVSEEVEALPGVVVYNVDDINTRASETLERRKAAIPQVENIIEESIQEFVNWSQSMIFSPTINKMKDALEQIRQEELAKHLKKMDEAEAKRVEKITKGMMQKILKSHVLQFKAACKRGEAENLVDVLNDLFNLEEESVEG